MRDRWPQAKPFVGPFAVAVVAMAVAVYLHELGHFAARLLGAQEWSIPFPASTGTPDEYREIGLSLTDPERILAAAAGPALQIGIAFGLLAFLFGRRSPVMSRLSLITGAVLFGGALTFAWSWSAAGLNDVSTWGDDLPRVAELLGGDQRLTMHLLAGGATLLMAGAGFVWLWRVSPAWSPLFVWIATSLVTLILLGGRGPWTTVAAVVIGVSLVPLAYVMRNTPGLDDRRAFGVVLAVVIGALIGVGVMEGADCGLRLAFFGADCEL